VQEPAVCRSCSAPITPGFEVCPRCGAPLGAIETPAASEGTRPAAQDARPASEDARPAAANDAAARAAAVAREAAAQAAAAKVAAVNAARDAELAEGELSDAGLATADSLAAADVPAVPEPEFPATIGAIAPDRFLAPSATNRTLGSIGAGRPTSTVAAPVPPVQTAAEAVATVPSGPVLLSAAAAATTPPAPVAPPLPVAPVTTSERIKATLASVAAEPKTELAATGLTALGGAFALVSFALPWAAENGLGVGTIDLNPRAGAWAFDTPAGWPLFLISALLLASLLASDKLEELMPGLAPTIRRLTETTVPMLLGGFLLGVSFLYLTLPWGCGDGLVLLAAGALLLIAGSIVGLFFPAGERRA
jgi:hypothetical protein